MEWEKYKKDEYGKSYVENIKGDKYVSQKERNAEGLAGCLVGLIFGAISFSYYTLKDQIFPFIKKALIEMYTFTRKHPKIALPIIAFFIIDAFFFEGKAVGYAESKAYQLYRICFVHTEDEMKTEKYYEDGGVNDTPVAETNSEEASIELQITMCEYCPGFPAEDGSSMCSDCISEGEEIYDYYEVYNTYLDEEEYLNLRSEATSKSINITRMTDGTKLVLLSKGNGSKGKWMKVRILESGEVGYAHSKWIRKINEE